MPEKLVICFRCNRQVPISDTISVAHRYWCSSCRNTLLDWHYDDGKNYYDDRCDWVGSKRRFGLELEVGDAPNLPKLFGNTPFGSKRDGSNGVFRELFSPPLQGNWGFNIIDELCVFALKNNWKVNNGCGYHIHLDMSHLAGLSHDQVSGVLAKIVLGYLLTEDYWRLLVPRHRRDNSYCIRLDRNFDITTLMKANLSSLRTEKMMRTTRYSWVAPCQYWSHKTVEIRLHTPTIHPIKVKNWLRVHLRFFDWLESKTLGEISNMFITPWITDDVISIHQKLVNIWRDVELGVYYKDRAAKFGDKVLTNWEPALTEAL